MHNIDLIEEIGRSYGFVVVTPGDYNFYEQIKIFENDRVVVGEHGAGLTNILFCRPGSQVLEIVPNRSYKQGSYERIAAAIGLEFIQDVYDPRPIKDITLEKKNLNKNGWYADPLRFEESLRKILSTIDETACI